MKSLDIWKLYEKQDRKCAISGLALNFEAKNISLDRIDSSIGYEEKNVQWVHKSVNVMKNGYSLQYFLSMCHEISQQNKNPKIDLNKEDSFLFGSH